MGNYIQTNWSDELRPYVKIEVRLSKSVVEYVFWHDSGKDPNIDSVSFENFSGSMVESCIKGDFGDDVYQQVCASIEALKKED